MKKNTYLHKDEFPLNRLPKTSKGNHHLGSWAYTVQILMNLEDGGDPWVALDHFIVANSLLQKGIDKCIDELSRSRASAIKISGECLKETSQEG